MTCAVKHTMNNEESMTDLTDVDLMRLTDSGMIRDIKY